MNSPVLKRRTMLGAASSRRCHACARVGFTALMAFVISRFSTGPQNPGRATAEVQISLGSDRKAPKATPTPHVSEEPLSNSGGSKRVEQRRHILFTTTPDGPKMPAKSWPLKGPQPLVRESRRSVSGQCPLVIRNADTHFNVPSPCSTRERRGRGVRL